MQKARTLALLLMSIACIAPAQSQGIMEGTFVRGLGAGMGAGTAASIGHGKVVRRTAESIAQAQQAIIAQTKVIEQSVATGIQMQAKKQWSSAEQYFQDALRMIAKRDGPGSPKSAPVLSRLANVAKNQHKLDEAIGYQKTVVAFANNARAQNPTAAVQAQVDLSNLFIDKGDLANAEGVLKQSADTVRRDRSIPPKTYSTTLRVYGEVLRKLNKNAEADVVDAELASQGTDSPSTNTAVGVQPNAPAVTVETADQSAAPSVVPVPDASATPAETNTTASAASKEIAAEEASARQVNADGSATVATSNSSPNSAPSAESAPTAPPGELLPPPTADWPVMNADGKIVSESSAESPAQSNAGGGPSVSAPACESPAPSDQSKGETETAASESKESKESKESNK